MGKKLNKEDILNEIQNKISSCFEYQCIETDESAKDRLSTIEKDPCNDSTYYVNITLKDCKSEDSINLSDRIKKAETKNYLPSLDEYKSAYEAGCIMTVNIDKKTGKYTSTAESCGSFDQLLSKLIEKYFDDSCILTTLKPKAPVLGNCYVEDDIKTATENEKYLIVYSIARFNKSTIETILSSQFDVEEYDLYRYDIQDFEDVGYVDMTRRTSFEQSVNQFFTNVSVMNNVTMFSAKSKLPDYNIMRKHGVYDMALFINNEIDEIKRSDEALSQKKYNKYSEGVFYDYTEAKYNTYKALGGTSDWATWNDAEGQFLTYKSVSTYDSEFLSSALDNSTYISNLFAYEQTANLFKNCDWKTVKTSWKKETDIFKKMTPSNLSFTECRETEKSDATSKVTNLMTDSPSVIVKPHEGTNIEFGLTINYDFNVAVKYVPSGEDETKSATTYVSPIAEDYETAKGYFLSKNKIEIKRDIVKVDGIEYTYTDVPIEIDKKNQNPYVNDITKEDGIYTIPEKSYYSHAMKQFFLASLFDTRVKQTNIIYYIIPKKVSIPIKFIQYSNWKNLAAAEQSLKAAKEEYKNDYIRLCVDSIPYDPWERMIDKLQCLYSKWNCLACVDGEFEFPPVEIIDASEQKKYICKSCNNTLDECKCEKTRLCTKSYPIDLFGISEDKNIDFGMMNASMYIYDTNRNPITYAEIAKEIYQSLYTKEYVDLYEFKKISKYSMTAARADIESIMISQMRQTKDSTISQFSRKSLRKFQKEYLNMLLGINDEIDFDSYFIKTLSIGLMDGLLYIPTGYSIEFMYDYKTNILSIDGIPVEALSILAKTLLTASEEDYYDIIEEKINEYGKNIISENLKKFLMFPYELKIEEILGQILSNEKYLIDENFEDYIYVIDADDLLAFKKYMTSYNYISIKFDIYLRKAVVCSYPRCVNPIYENDRTNGICGLDEFFRTPIIINYKEFDLTSELNKRKAYSNIKSFKKLVSQYIKNCKLIKDRSCDTANILQTIETIKAKAMKSLYEFNENYKDMISLVDKNPIDSGDQLSIVCSAANSRKLVSIIEDFDEVFTNMINTIKVLKEDNYNQSDIIFDKAIKNSVKDLGLAESYFDSFIKNSMSFNMCSTKFSEYIETDNSFITIENSTIDKEKTEVSKCLNKESEKRITVNKIFNTVKNLGFSETNSAKITSAITTGKTNELEILINKSNLNISVNELLNKVKIDESTGSSIECIKNTVNKILSPKSIDIPLLESVANPSKIKTKIDSICSNISTKSIIDNISKLGKSVDDITEKLTEICDSTEEIENILNTEQTDIVKMCESEIEGCQQPGQMTENIVGSVCGASTDDISNQNSTATKNLLSSNESQASVSNDIIVSMNKYINESCEDYRKITGNYISFD